MSVPAPENPPWGFYQWGLTALFTFFASGGAFLWRLMLRLDKLETSQARYRSDLEIARNASDAAMLRLAERFAQLHDDHFRVREIISSLPTRADFRDLEERLVERITDQGVRAHRRIDD